MSSTNINIDIRVKNEIESISSSNQFKTSQLDFFLVLIIISYTMDSLFVTTLRIFLRNKYGFISAVNNFVRLKTS